jgi:WD40 repeat protein
MAERRLGCSQTADTASTSGCTASIDPQENGDGQDNDSEEVYVVSGSEELSDVAEETPERDDAICVLHSHASAVYAVAITPDDSVIVSGGGDDRAYVWFRSIAATPKALRSFADSVGAVAVSSETVALGSLAGDVCLYRTEDLRESVAEAGRAIPLAQQVIDASVESLSANAEFVACGAADGALWLFDARSGNCLGVAYNHQGSVNVLRFIDGISSAEDEHLLITGAADATVRVWKRPLQGVLSCAQAIDGVFHRASVVSLETNGELILSGDESGEAFLANWRTGRALRSLDRRHEGPVESVAIGQDFLVTGGSDGFLHVYTSDARYRMSFQHEDVVVSVRKLRSWPQLFASASVDRTVRIWDTRVGSGSVRCFQGHRDAILTMDTGTDIIASAGDDETVRLFSLR